MNPPFNNYYGYRAPLRQSNVHFNGNSRANNIQSVVPRGKAKHKKQADKMYRKKIFYFYTHHGPNLYYPHINTDKMKWSKPKLPITDFTKDDLQVAPFKKKYVKKCEINLNFLDECLSAINIETSHRFSQVTTYETQPLSQFDTEFNFPSLTSNLVDTFVINLIEKIHNPFLLLQYELKKLQYQREYGDVKEMFLFHGTTYASLHEICNKNFNWRLFGTSSGCKFGQGVSFTPDFYYASHYGEVIILAKVLVSQHSLGDRNTVLPPDKHDTTTNDYCGVYVKYEDNTFLPVYVIHYVPKNLPMLL